MPDRFVPVVIDMQLSFVQPARSPEERYQILSDDLHFSRDSVNPIFGEHCVMGTSAHEPYPCIDGGADALSPELMREMEVLTSSMIRDQLRHGGMIGVFGLDVRPPIFTETIRSLLEMGITSVQIPGETKE